MDMSIGKEKVCILGDMKLIVESGATKTSWRSVSEDGVLRQTETPGLSPTCLDMDNTCAIVREAVPVLNPDGKTITEVFFYGAGLVSESSAAPLRSALELWCPLARIYFYSDILAAARALFGDGSGVVAIMGTGSNSCLYKDGNIIRNIRPGGYVLGDEGSAVALGKAFLADFIKGLLPKHIEEAFVNEFGLDYSAIVRKVYKEQAASAFMASIAPFIVGYSSDEYVGALIEECLDSFFQRAISRYYTEADVPVSTRLVGVVGSFGYACQDIIRKIAGRYDLEFVKFLKSPVDELVVYHSR